MNKATMLVAALALFGATTQALAEELPPMTVWKTPTCGCCGKWLEHMRAAGFKVEVQDVEDLETVKRLAGVRDHLQSCHTAAVGGYAIEGHVPAADVKRLLATKPKVRGLAVPGMPSGSPGMENGEREPYDVLSFTVDGKTEVFSRYNQ